MTTEVHLNEPPKPGENTPDPENNTPAPEVTAESLGVDDKSFEKYFKADDGSFNWEAYGKEQAFKAKQAAEKKAAQSDNTPDPNADSGEDQDDKDRKIVEGAGIDYDAMVTHLAEHGDIPDADREKLNKAGIPDQMIDDHIDFRQRAADEHVENVKAAFGGDEGWEKARAFVKDNFDEDEIKSINGMIVRPADFQAAVALIKSRMGDEAPAAVAPNKGTVHSPNGAPPATTAVKPFADKAEFDAAFRDERYKTDPGFRKEVMERARVSNIQMNPRAHTAGL